MPPLAKKPSRGTFQDFYAVKYALQVSKRDGCNGVREVECRMCQAFGHDEEQVAVGAKRKLMSRVKSWTGPCLRSDYFLRHLKRQHEEQWAIYQTLASDAEKEAFLDVCKGEEQNSTFDNTRFQYIMANQRKSTEALQAMLASMQADYMSLRQRELEVRERELVCLEAERRERQEDRRALREREQTERRGREEERKADHERFLALLQAMQAK